MEKKYRHIDRNNLDKEHSIYADTERLYGSIDEAIEYLQEIKATYPEDVSLIEHHWGYSDMAMKFIWTGKETDSERDCRIEQAKRDADYREEIAKEDAEREKKMAQYNKLKKELGIY